jgi:hypothetical protein
MFSSLRVIWKLEQKKATPSSGIHRDTLLSYSKCVHGIIRRTRELLNCPFRGLPHCMWRFADNCFPVFSIVAHFDFNRSRDVTKKGSDGDVLITIIGTGRMIMMVWKATGMGEFSHLTMETGKKVVVKPANSQYHEKQNNMNGNSCSHGAKLRIITKKKPGKYFILRVSPASDGSTGCHSPMEKHTESTDSKPESG